MLQRWLALGASLQALLAVHTLVPLAVVIFIEELGIPFLLPGDLTMMLAGARAAEGRASLWSVLLVEELATLAGAGLLFLASRRFGRPLVLRFGKYLGLDDARMAQAETRLRAHEMRSVILGRLIPGLRVVTVVAAGVAGVRPARFFPALAVGGFIYLLTYTILGYLAGPAIVHLLSRLVIPVDALWSLGGLAVIALLLRTLRRSEAARRAMRGTGGTWVIGGVLAGLAALLAANALIGVVAFGTGMPESALQLDTMRASDQLRILLGWPLFFVEALGVAALAGYWQLQERRVFVRRAVTVALPLAATLLLIDPLGDVAGVDSPSIVTALASGTAVLRWAAFALVLEVVPRPSRTEQSVRPLS